jgi:VanZ family protein
LTETFSRKGAHLVEYGVLSLLVFHALLAGGSVRRRALGGAFLFAFLYAASDEIHQSFVPGRYGKVRDVALDVLGAALVLSIYSRRRNTVGPSTDREIPS